MKDKPNCEKCNDTGLRFHAVHGAYSITYMSRWCDCPTGKECMDKILDVALTAILTGMKVDDILADDGKPSKPPLEPWHI